MRMMDTVKSMYTALGREPEPSDADIRDIGISRSDYKTLRDAPAGSRERMEFIAERFGVGAGQLNAEHWRALEMAQTCARCNVVDGCERLRIGATTSFEAADCPNATKFADLSV